MKRTTLITTLFLLFIALFAPHKAAAQDSATDLVKAFYATLVDTMKQGQKLGFNGRYKKLEPAITKTFNLPLMARYAVGPTWIKATEQDREKLVAAFSDFSIATYASRFTQFDGETFEVIAQQPTVNGAIMVETRLTPKDSDPVTLNYLVRKDETGNLRIVDVYLEASISELATRRAEFGSVVKREGFDALLSSLTEKTKKMGLAHSG